MSHGKFSQVDLPPEGRGVVTGPFDPQDEKVNFAKILFLIVQGKGRDTVVVPGQGAWSRDAGEWSGMVQRRGVPDLGGSDGELRPDEIARGIAVSIVVKPGEVLGDDTFDAPSIEALTWCADFMIRRAPSGAMSSSYGDEA
jgi:hypothetical protein